MADDAMDWNPSTPPAAHNPYSHPQYMPGGWPVSPPLFRHTSGVFARKRKPSTIECAAKRVCMGVWTVGIYATLPIKPLYRIVRDWKTQDREKSRRLRPDPAQSKRTPPAARARVAAAEEQLKVQRGQASPQQTATPPATPPRHQATCDLGSLLTEDRVDLQSPAATSVTNTETTLWSPASIRSTIGSDRNGAVSAKSKRPRVAKEGDYSESVLHASLGSYLAATQRAQQPTPKPDTPRQAKKMKGANRFDATYKHSSTAYGGRGSSGIRVRPIGTKLEKPDHIASLFGGWAFEEPIETAHPISPTPSQQMQSELESIVSEDTQPPAFRQKEDKSRERAAPIKGHDERWSTGPLLEMFLPGDSYKMKTHSHGDDIATAVKKQASVTSDAISLEISTKLFEEHGPFNTPPPVRKRPVIPAKSLRSLRARRVEHQPHATDNTGANKSSQQDSTSSLKRESSADLDELKSSELSGIAKVEEPLDIKPGNSNIIPDSKSVAVPATPLKTVAEKAAKYDLETTAVISARDSFETPAEKFSNLKIKDNEDNDTPKATPHSGTKTTRKTRLQEAREKAERAKLQQYELVPISDEWDQKVQDAVRSGIPDYLGPHDLARVVPQYATRGQDNWLNDETINKYLELVAAHGRKDDRMDQVRSHHTFNNFFYNNLKSKGPESVSKWSKRAKIGGKNLAYVEKIFIPVNSGAHWTLAVVEPTQKRISHYNSMRGAGTGIRACEDLKKWVASELGKDFKEEEWTLTSIAESPQQTNSDDCGVFTITSARQIMLGYNPMSYGPKQIPGQRIRIVAELINRGLLKSAVDT